MVEFILESTLNNNLNPLMKKLIAQQNKILAQMNSLITNIRPCIEEKSNLWFQQSWQFCVSELIQVIPGNDQNTSPTNQKTAGSKLERTSQLMFYRSRRHLKSFSGNFLVLMFLLGCLFTYLVKSLVFNATIFE